MAFVKFFRGLEAHNRRSDDVDAYLISCRQLYGLRWYGL
jgi:hypothetical protein